MNKKLQVAAHFLEKAAQQANIGACLQYCQCMAKIEPTFDRTNYMISISKSFESKTVPHQKLLLQIGMELYHNQNYTESLKYLVDAVKLKPTSDSLKVSFILKFFVYLKITLKLLIIFLFTTSIKDYIKLLLICVTFQNFYDNNRKGNFSGSSLYCSKAINIIQFISDILVPECRRNSVGLTFKMQSHLNELKNVIHNRVID